MASLADVRIGTQAPTRYSGKTRQWAAAVEASGFDFCGFGDSLFWDPYVAMAVAAEATSHIRLGTSVTNPLTRHPAVTARSIAHIHRLSNGRAVLGIGSGDSAVRGLGMTPMRLGYLQRYVTAVRQSLLGEEAEWDGGRYTVSWAPTDVPIWVAGDGPKTLEFAGRTAQAVIVAAGHDIEVIRDVRSHLEAGANAAGRDVDDIEIRWTTMIALADSELEAWRARAASLASLAHFLFRHSMDAKFVPAEHRAGLQALIDGYRTSEHNSLASRHHAELVEDGGLLEWLGRRFVLGGTPGHILGRLEELTALGVTHFIAPILDDDPFPALRDLSERLISKIPGRTR